MPHRFPAMERKTFGCTDFSDHKRSLLIALQVWDISDRCPKVDHRALLIFARKRSGMMFLQIATRAIIRLELNYIMN